MLCPWMMWVWVLGTFSFDDDRQTVTREPGVSWVEAMMRATAVQRLAAKMVPNV